MPPTEALQFNKETWSFIQIVIRLLLNPTLYLRETKKKFHPSFLRLLFLRRWDTTSSLTQRILHFFSCKQRHLEPHRMRFFLFVELFHQSHFKRAEKILNTALSNQFESRRHQTAIPPTTLPAAFQARMPTRLTPHYGQPGIWRYIKTHRHQLDPCNFRQCRFMIPVGTAKGSKVRKLAPGAGLQQLLFLETLRHTERLAWGTVFYTPCWKKWLCLCLLFIGLRLYLHPVRWAAIGWGGYHRYLFIKTTLTWIIKSITNSSTLSGV